MRRRGLAWGMLGAGVLGVIFAWGVAHAGWVVKMKTGEELMTLYLDERRGAKMVFEARPGMYMISRPDQKRTYQVDETKKTYMVLDWQEMEKRREMAGMAFQHRMKNLSPEEQAQMEQRLTQMREQMKEMPPRQRRRMEKLMQTLGEEPAAVQVEYRKTEAKATIHGFATRQVDKYENERKTQELWVAAVKDWQRLGKAWYNALQGIKQDDLPYEEMGGVPIRILRQGKAGQQVVSEVLSLEEASLTEKTFAPPAGYQESTLPDFMQRKPR